MGVSQWFAQHGFDLIQAVGVVGSLLFAAYTFQKNEKALRISNLLAIQQEYYDVWQAMYDRPGLARVLEKGVDLNKHPVTTREWLFVKMLILHLANIRRAMNMGMFVKLQGLQKDIQEFFALPIPKAVWEKMKAFQDDEFVAFVESCLNPLSVHRLKPI
jgi:hypothetical protein